MINSNLNHGTPLRMTTTVYFEILLCSYSMFLFLTSDKNRTEYYIKPTNVWQRRRWWFLGVSHHIGVPQVQRIAEAYWLGQRKHEKRKTGLWRKVKAPRKASWGHKERTWLLEQWHTENHTLVSTAEEREDQSVIKVTPNGDHLREAKEDKVIVSRTVDSRKDRQLKESGWTQEHAWISWETEQRTHWEFDWSYRGLQTAREQELGLDKGY